MLNEEYFIGESSYSKMDNKNRIWLPKFAYKPIQDTNGEVALCQINLELRVYLANTYQTILNHYEKILNEANLTYEEYTRIAFKIAEICASLDDVIKVDNKHRLLIPNMLMTQNNWQNTDSFRIKGYGKYLSITKNNN